MAFFTRVGADRARDRVMRTPPDPTPADVSAARIAIADCQRYQLRQKQREMKREKRRKGRHKRERRRLEWASGGSAN